MADFDAVVIGAGVIGAAIALGLARDGRKVLVVDKGGDAGHGSTAGSCAIIRPYYSTLEGCALAYESHFYWKDWANFLGAEDERSHARYVNCGCMVMKTPDNGFLERGTELMDALSCPYDDLDGPQLVAKMPWLTTDSFSPPRLTDDPAFGESNGAELPGAVFFKAGGYVTDPALAAHNLMRAAEAEGAVFRFRAEVSEILSDDETGRIQGFVLADGDRIETPVLVNVAGPHSYKINEMADVSADMTIKTRALRHEVAHVPVSDENYHADGTVFSDSDVSAYTRPEHGGNILIGSEDPPCDERIWADPDDFDREFSNQWTTLVMRAGQRMPSLGVPNTAKGVVELYDVSDDWIPIYDKSSKPGYYMAIGTSGNQFKNAPVVGEFMAKLIRECEEGRDHDRDPVTFHLKNLGREIDLGFYSRNREINADSSMSVLG